MNKIELEKNALKVLFERYLNILINNKEKFNTFNLPEKCDFNSLNRLLTEAVNNLDNYPKDKMHRWLGFIQGVLSVIGLIDVDEEREFSRPLLHSYHEEKPKSF